MAVPPTAPDSSPPWWDLSPRQKGLVVFALLFLATIPMLTKIFTSDFGTHLALGRYIVHEHSIPTRELWNYPSLGMENASGGEWGFQAILYLVYSTGGVYGVSLLLWAVVFGIFFFLFRSCVLRGSHPLLAVLAIFAFSGFLRIRIQPRPEIFTYLFTSMTIYVLTEYYFGERKKLIYLFPGLILVWANMHPTYLMAFVLCGAFFADRLARDAWKKELQWSRLKTWIIPPVLAGGLGLIVCGLNPHGYSWLLSPLHLISRGQSGGGGGGSAVLMSISELTPVKGTGLYLYYKAAAGFVALSLLLGGVGRRIYLLDLFLFTIAFKGAWDSARAVSMMGLFLSPGASLHLTGFFGVLGEWFAPKSALKQQDPAGDRERKKKKKGKKKPEKSATPVESTRGSLSWSRLTVSTAILVAIVTFGTVTLSFSFTQLQYGIGMTEHKFSFAAAEFLRKYPVRGKMFNFFDIGGFLDWQLYPQALTFIDGRTYNKEVFREHQIVTGAIPGWEDVLRKYGITYIVLKSVDSSGTILPIIPALSRSPDWSLVFSDGLFVIFVRNTEQNREYISKHAISKSVLPRQVIEESYHYMHLGVSPVIAYANITNMYLTMGKKQSAIDALRKALGEMDNPYLRSMLVRLEQTGAPR
jgi:hypothetical protein